MPIYEYRCGNCGHTFEMLIIGSKDDIKVEPCPSCGSGNVQRILSAFSGKIGNTSGSASSCGSCSATTCPPS